MYSTDTRTRTHTCHACKLAIPAGHAVLRSISLREVRAWHRDCFTVARVIA